jgi:hypothetical protein
MINRSRRKFHRCVVSKVLFKCLPSTGPTLGTLPTIWRNYRVEYSEFLSCAAVVSNVNLIELVILCLIVFSRGLFATAVLCRLGLQPT